MTTQRPEGSFVALITPMNADCSIDFEGFRTLFQFHEENGTSALLIMGSTGEVSMLSQKERHTIVHQTMKMRTGKMSIYYGCTGPTTETTIDYVAQAASEGADGAIIAAPAYICASKEDTVQFCLEVADASDIPLGSGHPHFSLRYDTFQGPAGDPLRAPTHPLRITIDHAQVQVLGSS